MKSPSFKLDVSSPLRQLLIHCQINCRADCCRARAFEISAAMIARWLEFERVDRTRELFDEIERVKESLPQIVGEIILEVRDLESAWPVVEFKAFLDRLGTALTMAAGRTEATPRK